MVIKSKINLDEYFYVKVPKTGTMAYTRLFLSEIYPEIYSRYIDRQILHNHNKYNSQFPGIAVVRNPYTRFISIINYLKHNLGRADRAQYKKVMDPISGILLNTNFDNEIDTSLSAYNFTDIFKTEDFFYDFFYSGFEKNCEIKNQGDVQLIFNAQKGNFVQAFFVTQVQWAYHPKIKVFKYEKIQEFNEWIRVNLGYDVSKLETVNKITKNNDMPIDFSSNKFKELTKYLFYDDFRYFNYEFPI
jgi:hypothetical protein